MKFILSTKRSARLLTNWRRFLPTDTLDGLAFWSWCVQLIAAIAVTAGYATDARAQVLGPRDAPVTIMMFSAFTCPYCAQAHDQLEALSERFPGKIRLIFRHFPLSDDETDMWPHLLAAAASEQGRFGLVYHGLFSRPELRKKSSPIAVLQLAALGVDYARITDAIGNGVAAQRISDDQAEAVALKVRASPTFFVDGIRLDGLQDSLTMERLVSFRVGSSVDGAQKRFP